MFVEFLEKNYTRVRQIKRNKYSIAYHQQKLKEMKANYYFSNNILSKLCTIDAPIFFPLKRAKAYIIRFFSHFKKKLIHFEKVNTCSCMPCWCVYFQNISFQFFVEKIKQFNKKFSQLEIFSVP